MIVWCDCQECKYNEEGQCIGEVICLDQDGECEDFESYLEEKEWQTPYWKRMLDRDNNRVCRVQYYGNEFEVKGRKFYVDFKGEYSSVTDGETGLACGRKSEIESRIDKISKAAQSVKPRLEELPIATYNDKTRKFTYESEGDTE
jgi:hypothetical protein